ncbi:MAG: metallophosphoesterase family protein [Rubricoccaceae bacterium]|nr:metallophosphoesterase family protein [Rubricoccaceae bacterium]
MLAQSTKDEARSTKIAHLSDIHFGRISHPGIVDVLIEDVNAAGVDLVAISGDLTQRAKDRQYADAKAMLEAFDAPVLVVPGNHDVRQFWHNPIERVRRPTIRFERYISNDLRPSFSIEGLSVFGLNSAHGRTIKGGLIRYEDIEAMAAYFQSRPTTDFRVLVVHHHLIKDPSFKRTDVAIGADATLIAAITSGVDLILCGHYHISKVTRHEPEEDLEIVIASAGTATSSRGRGEQKEDNVYNLISVNYASFVVEERRFDPATAAYDTFRSSEFAWS